MTFLYTCFAHLILPFALLRLQWRARNEPGYREAIAERLGRYPVWNDTRPLIWLHAVSLGETRAAAPLIEGLLKKYPEHRLLLTHMTPTGRQAGKTLFANYIASGRMRQAWLPYDLPWAIRAFLRHYQPRLGLIMETEIWPNLVRVCALENVPLCLVNGRLSARSAARYAKFSAARVMFQGFTKIFAQSEADAQRFTQLGAEHVIVTGNLKFDVSADPKQVSQGRALHELLQPRAVFCASNTREGEEVLIIDAWKSVRQYFQQQQAQTPLLVLVPRHPQRFQEVAELITQTRDTSQTPLWELVKRSSAQADILSNVTEIEKIKTSDVWLGDTLGEMQFYYAVADAVFVGGSLVPLGGHNLIEACAAGKPVLIGPHMFNFMQASLDAKRMGAAIEVCNAKALAKQIVNYFSDKTLLQQHAVAATNFAKTYTGATERTLVALPLI